MLSQVELGRSAPTISTLSRVALALDVPFSVLLCDARQRESVVIRAGSTSALTSHDATFMSRPLFPPEEARPVEFYEVRLAPDAVKKAPAQAPETTENLVVASGALVLTVRGERHHLGPGDAILFHADAPYEYRNGGLDEVCAYVVVALQRTSFGVLGGPRYP
jgi:quercetin dioxygenase-like cupin family protein